MDNREFKSDKRVPPLVVLRATNPQESGAPYQIIEKNRDRLDATIEIFLKHDE